MTPAHNTPAIIYTRVSTHKQAESMDALLAQEAECRRVCEFRRWQVVEVIQEVQSGAKDVRSGWERACELAKEHHGVVVVQDTSRMTRSSSLDTLHGIYQRAIDEGFAIYALDLPQVDLTDPAGEAFLGFMAIMHRFQRRMTGKKTSASLRAKIARGEPVGRPRQYTESMLGVLRALRSEGLAYQEIADTLNKQGVTTIKGSPWSKQMVYETLKRYGASAPRGESDGREAA